MTVKGRLSNANTARQQKARLARARDGWERLVVPLSEEESHQLVSCEEVIENGIRIWYQVGEALLHIRDKRLYRATHKTFEEYCQERWQMSRPRAYQLISASEVYQNLSTKVDILPMAETHVRPLAPYTPEVQELAWRLVEETAPNKKVTEAHVKSVISVVSEAIKTGAIDDGTGEQIPVSQATSTHFKAAITEETYERMKRQEAHIAEKQQRKASPQTLATDEYEWYTPPRYLEAARAVLGQIDLDPASSAQANLNVKAIVYFTKADDGLPRSWNGRVWLNPPYGSMATEFVSKLIGAYTAGHVTEAIVLVNANSTDTRWFQPLWKHTLCFTDHRIDFLSPYGEKQSSSTHGSVFVYLGTRREVFAQHFRPFGAVVAQLEVVAYEPA